MKGCFISGTDTGVGKTLIGGAVARALVQSGKSVGVMKPFESGCTVQGDRLIPNDALFLKKMAKCHEDLDKICPYSLKHPLAPWVAAKLENKTIELGKIKHIFLSMLKRYDFVLVEGAGGLMVPIDENLLILDLIHALNLPLIIVARLSLGTINHVLLTVKQAQTSGITVAGIILNQVSPETGKAEETNPQVIKKFTTVPIIGQMPFIAPDKRDDAEYLSALAAKCIDLSHFS